ncbi:MAG TPA: type II secretion system protein GspM, partial [Solirubrobacteraceae bacterium]|nr:type II secretion system protein GspM [Solirubrobacteraceae bacterium]
MTTRDRTVLAVIGVAALLAGFWMLVLKPKREEVAELKQQVTAEEDRRDEALARVRAGEEARRSFAEDYAIVARLGKAVPVGDQTPSLLYQLETAARAQSIDFRSMKVRS